VQLTFWSRYCESIRPAPGTLRIENSRRSIWAGIDYGRTRMDENEGKPYGHQFEEAVDAQ
jgi:hypothetical protein